MFTSTNSSLESMIITLLQKGPLNTTVLIETIKSIRKSTTKQGVYFALRSLSKQEVVVFRSKQASLNVRWIKKMSQFFSSAEKTYKIDSDKS